MTNTEYLRASTRVLDIWTGHPVVPKTYIYTKEQINGTPEQWSALKSASSSYESGSPPCLPVGMNTASKENGRQYEHCTEYVKHE